MLNAPVCSQSCNAKLDKILSVDFPFDFLENCPRVILAYKQFKTHQSLFVVFTAKARLSDNQQYHTSADQSLHKPEFAY